MLAKRSSGRAAEKRKNGLGRGLRGSGSLGQDLEN